MTSINEKFKLVYETIHSYPSQLKQSWQEVQKTYIPANFKDVDNIVFCGMGGSALGARIIDSYAFNSLRVPFEIFNDYRLPQYVNNKTLVILSSYSGTTEETLESTYAAIEKQAKIFAITTGGTLSDVVLKEKLSGYIFEPNFNPSGQPRMSIGYASGAVLSLLARLGFISLEEEDIENTISVMQGVLTEFQESIAAEKNLPKKIALDLKNKIPVIIASDHLLGVAHTIKNQFNESAKTFSLLFDIPELNHHLMEGLKNPRKSHELFTFLFFNSGLYPERIQKRYPLTSKVVQKNAIECLSFTPRSEKRLSQVYETLVFGSLLVYFLTKEYGIDPMEIPWVDYFKKELTKI
jgi:glucose/mannose-6-phosphate isomerase